jgi:hypothetical protein
LKALPADPSKAPRRKFRGKRRYFRKVLREAEAFQLDTTPGCWWEFWHYHADWRGWGNRRWAYRREHFRALAVVFRKVVDGSATIPVPFQTWISIEVGDAGMDGVFVHSVNPNRDSFPCRIEGAIWAGSGPLHDEWSALLPGLRLRVGRSSFVRPDEGDGGGPENVETYCVYSPYVGVSLEVPDAEWRIEP